MTEGRAVNVEVALSGDRTVDVTFDWSGNWSMPAMLDLDDVDTLVLSAVTDMVSANINA
ncbi:hypothetical protein [Lentzea sp. E54]|uniref:hypothetical protein n=1 Tax=Lentzea xerophila TaxID=3435883 RepID=UPI003DA26C5E